MSDKILVVTSPDDTLIQGIRVAHIDLTEEQSTIVSHALFMPIFPDAIINYVWKVGDPVNWLFDKINKCDLILVNADSSNELIVGWMSAQPNAYYFGNLKDLHLVNNQAIYSDADVLTLLEKISKHYE